MAETIRERNQKVRERIKIQLPKDWMCILHNDDITPFEVVVMVLMRAFNKSPNEAMALMMEANNNERALVAEGAYDTLATMKRDADAIIVECGVPLRFTLEEKE